jgi:mitochondria-eating protein
LSINPKICLPIGVNYSVISSFIREACRVAWHLSCLAHPIDIAFAIDAEVIDESK